MDIHNLFEPFKNSDFNVSEMYDHETSFQMLLLHIIAMVEWLTLFNCLVLGLKSPLVSTILIRSATHFSLGSVQNSRPFLMVKLEENKEIDVYFWNAWEEKLLNCAGSQEDLHHSSQVAAAIGHLQSVPHCTFLSGIAQRLHILQTAVFITHWEKNQTVKSEMQSHHT